MCHDMSNCAITWPNYRLSCVTVPNDAARLIIGGSSFEIADTSPYSTSPYANAKINQSQAAATPQQKSKGARLGFRNRRKNKVGRGVHRSEEVSVSFDELGIERLNIMKAIGCRC